VPAANGGTGKSSVTSGTLLVGAGTSAMTELAGTTTGDAVTWNGSAWVSGTVGGAMPGIATFVAPGTWSKPASIKGIKVTVVGAGGNGGTFPTPANGAGAGGGGGGAAIDFIPAPSIPGPVSVTAGPGTNSFGAFCSATAGSNAVNTNTTPGGAGGIGSGGSINIQGGGGGGASPNNAAAGGTGGNSLLGAGAAGTMTTSPGARNGTAGGNYGGGGSGAARNGAAVTPSTGGTGAPGIVIVEEFY